MPEVRGRACPLRTGMSRPRFHWGFPAGSIPSSISSHMLTGRPILSTTRADDAYLQLKRMITYGELPPGAEFTELQAAELLESGRTPVREALARLRNSRLVVMAPGRRYAVAPISLSDVRDLFGLRRLLETEAARLAAGHIDATHLRQMDAACSGTYDRRDQSSVSRFLRANSEFHLAVGRASQNARFADVLAPLLDEMERLLHLSLRASDRSGAIVHDHQRLITALEEGDAASAAAEAEAQLDKSERNTVQALIDRAFAGKIATVGLG